MCHLSESFWTTNSNERQADSCDKSSECYKAERNSTALGQGSNVSLYAHHKHVSTTAALR